MLITRSLPPGPLPCCCPLQILAPGRRTIRLSIISSAALSSALLRSHTLYTYTRERPHTHSHGTHSGAQHTTVDRCSSCCRCGSGWFDDGWFFFVCVFHASAAALLFVVVVAMRARKNVRRYECTHTHIFASTLLFRHCLLLYAASSSFVTPSIRLTPSRFVSSSTRVHLLRGIVA